ncbi:MAG: alpha-L-rhamnosidase [Pedobacter sp.]|nr:MAG: alpha-L-rhamnosidase [Pedobacter sp.]
MGRFTAILFLLLNTIFLASLAVPKSLKPKVMELSCEYRSNPLGVMSAAPKLSWKFTSEGRNITQTAYQVLVSDDLASLRQQKGNIWNSGKVASSKSIQVAYAGTQLLATKRYYYKVKVWDNKGNVSDWSAAGLWQMGLLNDGDWKGAKWIGYEEMPESERIVPAVHLRGNFKEKNDILPLLRKRFKINKTIKNATAFVSGLGHFEMSINGKKVGDHFLDPGWTDYDKEALYVTFDVTKMLQNGNNALGIILGNGFYFIPRDLRYRKITGAYGFPKMICRVHIEYTDGSQQNIISNESWKASLSPITFTSIYGGEDYNATLEQAGWDLESFDDSKWNNATGIKGITKLNSQMALPLKVFETLSPVKVTQVKPGIWIYDMGQNASAIPSISVKGKRGDVVRISPAELLNADGTINQSASGDPHYYDYTLKGQGSENWQPKFTYYGFRYIQIQGAVPDKESNPDGKPVLIDVKSLHVRNAAKRTGTFTSSNELFNKTNTLIDWAIKSNMVSVFTDCPHREKLGWLEQAHLMGGSVQYNYDVAALNRKVVDDMITGQTENGLIPDITPEYVHFDGGFRDSPEWGSNGIILPWYMYEWYGDRDVLLKSYPMMEKYIVYIQSKAKDNILSHGLGDWFDIGPNNPGEAQLTPKALTATAIYYYNLSIMRKIAQVLNKRDDGLKYERLAAAVYSAFNKAFFNPETKQYATGSQTANAMSIYMDLVAPKDKQAVLDNLVKEIKGRGNSLTAGDIGYRYVLRVLDDAGRSDVIYDMNSRSDVPGYGWQLAHGATALTESWQAYGFVSNNHFMLGHLMEWLYSGIGGIRAAKDAIAYKTLEIRPQAIGNLTSSSTTFETPYGHVLSSWKKTGSSFELTVEIPANSFAEIVLPVNGKAKVFEGDKLVNLKGNNVARISEHQIKLKVGSGRYSFRVR